MENIQTDRISVSLKNNFWKLFPDLTAGELRTMALLLSYKETFVIYEEVVARQQGFDRKTAERRFKKFKQSGMILKRIKVGGTDKLNFTWTLTFKAKGYKAEEGQKDYTIFRRSFILDPSINDFDWLVLSIILCNKSDYRTYYESIREKLSIDFTKRSRVSTSIKRLAKKNLVVIGLDSNKGFCTPTDNALKFIARVDRSNYETYAEKCHNKAEEVKRKLTISNYEEAKALISAIKQKETPPPKKTLKNPYSE